MSDREQFLRAIEAEPHADLPRLVFADWLDEQGDPERAEFIRAQCEAYRIRYGPPPRGDRQIPAAEMKRMQQLTARAADLLGQHRSAWTAGLPEWARHVGFQRGFQDFYYFTGKQLLVDGDVIRQAAPLAGYLSLRLTTERPASIFACRHLEVITDLDLSGCKLTDASVKLLAKSPHLRRVRQLKLNSGYMNSNRLSDAAAVALAEADNLPALTRLKMSGPNEGMTAAGIGALCESPLRAGLTLLDVSGYREPDASFAEVFRSKHFKLTALTVLHIGGSLFGDEVALALAACPHLGRLVELDLHESDLSDRGAKAILESPHLGSLRSLNLMRNRQITYETARLILADSRPWQQITLFGTEVSERLQGKVSAKCRR